MDVVIYTKTGVGNILSEEIKDIKHIEITVDNSMFRIDPLDEGITICEFGSRRLILVPDSEEAIGIITN